jgi:hypothetical protein
VCAETGIEAPAAEIARAIRQGIGPRARASEEEGWTDILIASREGSAWRRRMPNVPAPVWESGATQ